MQVQAQPRPPGARSPDQPGTPWRGLPCGKAVSGQGSAQGQPTPPRWGTPGMGAAFEQSALRAAKCKHVGHWGPTREAVPVTIPEGLSPKRAGQCEGRKSAHSGSQTFRGAGRARQSWTPRCEAGPSARGPASACAGRDPPSLPCGTRRPPDAPKRKDRSLGGAREERIWWLEAAHGTEFSAATPGFRRSCLRTPAPRPTLDSARWAPPSPPADHPPVPTRPSHKARLAVCLPPH